MADNQAVRLEQVSRCYAAATSAAVRALDEISVVFERTTFTAIMGPSGSGKSTLLQCAAGLDRPDSGRVVVDDIDLGPLSEKALTELRRDRIGFIFQAFNLLGALSAEQNVGLPLRLAGRRPDSAEVRAALAQVGLGERAGHLPSQMSGGQQQRVAIARALITRPKVLFADEPTGALDSSSSRTVLKLLRTLVDEQGQTTIMVTHDPVAASYADRVVFLVDGRITDEMRQPTAQGVAEHMALLEADTAPARVGGGE
ncbi:ABC transporter ATP-binding protein [Streptomyces sp. NBC_01260]|uniref:ABC transporter ATP-binding protein n=1 Tax=unclassified Streptomyces TaxID=2593676 RepID=UPI000F49A166|nr:MULTISPECIES: ABC transporter ATP-binding protein [unclassified Streptomyces]MCX4772539.1 ABC transporter ATP-binding protein [Streptomyces sp. NBC_01285]ROQ71486.1 putative ABC transport system ATP-binding protein [Streptomyces sp. CEV 2-1]RPK51079.1 ABC transporter ATP-binding protein YxdL [Streptomyces sp. ADI92-24]